MGDTDHKGAHQLPPEEKADGESSQRATEEEHKGKHCQNGCDRRRSSRPESQ